MTSDPTPIRDAATVILLRQTSDGPAILMGQRGAKAAFMPNKFVFPGGAVDADDADVSLINPVAEPCLTRLREDAARDLAHAMAAAAIREVCEETGQIIGAPGDWPDAPPDWAGFAATGHRPDAQHLHFFFRAITPPGRPRRFDARFFLMDAARLCSDPDDFSSASDELSHLQWMPIAQARNFNLPFITEVVLAEVANLTKVGPPASVPFFKNDDEDSLFLRLYGTTPTE
ncbi:MAG: NUDIX hydrolase [Pseudomonadota bacterium]